MTSVVIPSFPSVLKLFQASAMCVLLRIAAESWPGRYYSGPVLECRKSAADYCANRESSSGAHQPLILSPSTSSGQACRRMSPGKSGSACAPRSVHTQTMPGETDETADE